MDPRLEADLEGFEGSYLVKRKFKDRVQDSKSMSSVIWCCYCSVQASRYLFTERKSFDTLFTTRLLVYEKIDVESR